MAMILRLLPQQRLFTKPALLTVCPSVPSRGAPRPKKKAHSTGKILASFEFQIPGFHFTPLIGAWPESTPALPKRKGGKKPYLEFKVTDVAPEH